MLIPTQPDMDLKALQIPPALLNQSSVFPADLSGVLYLRTGNALSVWPNVPANSFPSCFAARTGRV